MNDRDTHFQGFAKLLIEEMVKVHGHVDIIAYWTLSGDFWSIQDNETTREYITLIAQRAFDLAEHVIKHIHGSDLDEMKDEGLQHFLEVSYPEYKRLPDLTEWPSSEEQ